MHVRYRRILSDSILNIRDGHWTLAAVCGIQSTMSYRNDSLPLALRSLPRPWANTQNTNQDLLTEGATTHQSKMLRRQVLTSVLLLLVLSSPCTAATQWLMPDEAHSQARTWMAFAHSENIWGEELLSAVQQDLCTIANTIAVHQVCAPPVHLCRICFA
jgi:hypothetical protein